MGVRGAMAIHSHLCGFNTKFKSFDHFFDSLDAPEVIFKLVNSCQDIVHALNFSLGTLVRRIVSG